VPVPDFFFALQIDDAAAARGLFEEVSARLLQYAADGSAFVAALEAGVAKAAADAGAGGTLQVRAEGGTLEVVVRNGGREIWRAAHPLP
jgi:hypothetical protein